MRYISGERGQTTDKLDSARKDQIIDKNKTHGNPSYYSKCKESSLSDGKMTEGLKRIFLEKLK
jgi:hypothetical protein